MKQAPKQQECWILKISGRVIKRSDRSVKAAITATMNPHPSSTPNQEPWRRGIIFFTKNTLNVQKWAIGTSWHRKSYWTSMTIFTSMPMTPMILTTHGIMAVTGSTGNKIGRLCCYRCCVTFWNVQSLHFSEYIRLRSNTLTDLSIYWKDEIICCYSV